MKTKLTIDRAGRVVIPKPLRERLRLSPGDSLQMESSENAIVLRPMRSEPRYFKKHGILVCDTGVPIPDGLTDQVLQAIRDERDAQNLGMP